MRRKTHVLRTIFGGWGIFYYLDNGFPVLADSIIYPYKWMAQLSRWWVEGVHGNYIED